MNQHQKDILHKISNLTEAQYNQLRNDDLDPKQSAYHLQKLMKEGYIEKKDAMYLLTLEGKKFINNYEHEEEGIFQTGLSNLIYAVNSEGKVLVVTREKAPFIGFKGNPTGRIKENQLSQEAVNEELMNWGINEKPKLAGILDYLYEDEYGVNSKTIMLIYYIEFNIQEGTKLREGASEWINKEDLIAQEPGFDNTKDIVEIIDNFLKDNTLQFVSKRYKTKL